jgi:predicted enzyme related to lactoylglutathione lyase
VETQTNEGRIDYIEFAATDIAATKTFYESVFGWKFTDYGPDYTSFGDGRIAGGFARQGGVTRGGPLVVMYSSDLAGKEAAVRTAGGVIVKEIFSFPGGRRFHFTDPNGNELSVWSDK